MLLLLQINYVPTWAGLEPAYASLPLDLVACRPSIPHKPLESLNPERVMEFCTHIIQHM